MKMIAGSKGKTLVAHAHGRSVEKSLAKSLAIGGKKPFATSGFFRRASTLLVDLASFYLESNCMKFLLKSADKVTGLLHNTHNFNVADLGSYIMLP